MKLHAWRIAAGACACWLALLVPPPASVSQTQQQSTRPDAARPEEVVLSVTVTDAYGRLATGLGREAFSVKEGNSARGITHFRELADEPMSVALVFDSSRSMRMTREAWGALKSAASRLVSAGHEESEYFVAEFGGEGGLRVVGDWARDRGTVAAALARVAADPDGGQTRARGLTYWKDACAGALDAFGRASHARRAVVLFGDAGEDSGSRTGGAELKRRMRKSGATFYAVILPTGIVGYEGPVIIGELASATGGRAYYPETMRELGEVIERIALELRHQYAVGFTPLDAAPEGEWSKVQVKVAKPEKLKGSIYVRSAGGYFSRGTGRR